MRIIGIGIVAFILFLIQRYIYEKLWDKNLKATVSFKQSKISEGEQGDIIEVIENRKYLPLRMLKVKFQTSRYLGFADDIGSKTTDQYYRNDIFQIGGGEKITRKLTFVAEKRGYYHIKNIDLASTDIFMSNEYTKSMSADSYLYVYPRKFSEKVFKLSLQKVNGEVLVKRHLLEDPFEYRGIREYQPYDDMRSVNWKATAKTGVLKVNQKNYTAMQTIRIFLNLEDTGFWKKEKEIEAAIQMVMGIASYFLSLGIKVSCYANSCDIVTKEPIEVEGGAGVGQYETIGKVLAKIDTRQKAKDFCSLFEHRILENTDAYYTFFVSPNGYEDFVSLMKTCQDRGMDFCWYYPVLYYQEPKIIPGLEERTQVIKIQ